MLDATQRAAFVRCGFITVAKAVNRRDVTRMKRRLWRFLQNERGIAEHRRESWPKEARPTGLQKLSRTGAFAEMLSPLVRTAVDDLLGAGTAEESRHRPVPLVVFPETHAWRVPGGRHTWHVDAPVEEKGCVALRAFLLLDAVDRHTGPTLAVAGSARLARRIVTERGSTAVPSRRLAKVLAKAEPWIRDLVIESGNGDRERFLRWGTSLDRLPLRVVPLVGEAGDVVLMDLATLHSKSANASHLPRLVVGQTFWAVQEKISSGR